MLTFYIFLTNTKLISFPGSLHLGISLPPDFQKFISSATFGPPLNYSSFFCFFHMSAQIPFLKEAGLLWPLLLKKLSCTPLHTIILLFHFALFLFFLLITVCSLFLPITWTKATKEKSHPSHSVQHPLCLKRCLEHSICSIKIGWMSTWMK